jgi:hypothetical protein
MGLHCKSIWVELTAIAFRSLGAGGGATANVAVTVVLAVTVAGMVQMFVLTMLAMHPLHETVDPPVGIAVNCTAVPIA